MSETEASSVNDVFPSSSPRSITTLSRYYNKASNEEILVNMFMQLFKRQNRVITDPQDELFKICRMQKLDLDDEEILTKLYCKVERVLKMNIHIVNGIDSRTKNNCLHMVCDNPVMVREFNIIKVFVNTSAFIGDDTEETIGKCPEEYICSPDNEIFFPTLARILRQKNEDGQLPLHVACQNPMALSNAETIQFLIDGNPGAVCFPDNEGKCPIHHVIQAATYIPGVSMQVFLSLFKQWRECIKIPDAEGNLLIHLAAEIEPEAPKEVYDRQYEIVQLLLRVYPDSVEHRNKNNQTPYEVAKESSDNQMDNPVVLLLRDHDPQALSELPTEEEIEAKAAEEARQARIARQKARAAITRRNKAETGEDETEEEDENEETSAAAKKKDGKEAEQKESAPEKKESDKKKDKKKDNKKEKDNNKGIGKLFSVIKAKQKIKVKGKGKQAQS